MTDDMCDKIMTEITKEELAGGFLNNPSLTTEQEANGEVMNPFRMITRTNRARAAYNLLLMKKMGKELGRPVLVYKRPIKAHAMLEKCEPMLHNVDRFPEAHGFFLQGCSAFIVHNANVEFGLANGSGCEMVGIRWSSSVQNANYERAISAAGPGEVIYVDEPELIIVKMKPHKDPTFWREHVASFPNGRNLCVPDETTGKKTDVVIAIGWTPGTSSPAGDSFSFGKLKFTTKFHYVEPDLAQTIWKVQGQGFPRCLVDLNKAFHAMPLTWEQVYVILTRVPSLSSIRCMPVHNREALKADLMKMRPSFHATRFRMFAEEMARKRRLSEVVSTVIRVEKVPQPEVVAPAQALRAVVVDNDDPNGKQPATESQLQESGAVRPDVGALPKWKLLGSIQSDGVKLALSLSNTRRQGGKKELVAIANKTTLGMHTIRTPNKTIVTNILTHYRLVPPSSWKGNTMTLLYPPPAWMPPRGMWNVTPEGLCANACFAIVVMQCLLCTPFVVQAVRAHGGQSAPVRRWLKSLIADSAIKTVEPMRTLGRENADVIKRISPLMGLMTSGAFPQSDAGEFMDQLFQQSSVQSAAINCFGVSTQMTRCCATCKTQTFVELSIPECAMRGVLGKADKTISMNQLMERKLQEIANEGMEGACTRCKCRLSNVVKIAPTGSHLIVHIDRRSWGHKNTATMSAHTLNKKLFVQPMAARLVAMARHHGGEHTNGHFTMDGERIGQWWHMDDQVVQSRDGPQFEDATLAIYELQTL